MKSVPSAMMGNLLMVFTAAIWGFTFVAQKTGMDHLGPFMFNAVRFFIGATCLVFLLRWFKSQKLTRKGIFWGIAMGVVLFIGAMLQQIGLIETTAGKSAFITVIYILLVPVFLSFLGNKLPLQIWPAAFLVLYGLYLINITEGDLNGISNGDYWVLASAIFWASHILIIEKAVKYHDPLRLSIVQFYICSFLALLGVFIFEPVGLNVVWEGVQGAWLELAYAGVAATAIAYTLQVVAQKSVPSHHAALVLSLEAVFGVIGGVWLLGEDLTVRMLLGFSLMFAGIILAQWSFKKTPQLSKKGGGAI
jgi:drug/metabolite transporter (DMT)-like permease